MHIIKWLFYPINMVIQVTLAVTRTLADTFHTVLILVMRKQSYKEF